MSTDYKAMLESTSSHQPTASNPAEAVVMLQALTLDDVEGWDFIDTTPAHRKLYHNKELDIIAYVTSNKSKIQFYFNRWSHGGAFAACFNDNFVVELAS